MSRQGRNGGSPLLIITSIASSNISGAGATVSWSTNRPADSQVEYGSTTGYGNVISVKTMETSHRMNIVGLSPNTLYHYRVKSQDDSNNQSTSGDLTFTTANGGSPTPTPTPGPGIPTISTFTASPGSITSGQTSVLSWSVTGATGLKLDPGNINVTGQTSRSVTPSGTTTYSLTATNSAGAVTKSVKVTVTNGTPPPPLPVISSFTASPSVITSGQTSVLSWVVTGATSLRLDPGDINVTGATSRQVAPTATTHYTLTATNNAGSQAQSVTVTVVSPGGAELPRVFLNTGYIPPTGRTINVAANAGAAAVQAAIDQAQPGDVVMLAAGATFTGNFRLPNKSGSGWVIIRTSAADADLPPPGTRVTPANSALMPKLITPNFEPVIDTNAAAHHYRFIGVEFGVAGAAGTDPVYSIVSFDGNQSSLSQTPNNLIIDRCYIHGNATRNVRRGVLLNSASTAIIDSYISDIHETEADSQAACGWNGPGPFKIVNNYLEGAGENVMFGGATPSITGLVPSDIEFRLNHVAKPLTWKRGDPSYAGRDWSIKNLFELKNAQRLLIDQNIFERNWLDSQTGYAILFTPSSEDGQSPWSTVADVTFTNNIVRHSGSGFVISGADGSSNPSQRILIRNNLLDDINGDIWRAPEGAADGRAILIVNGAVSVVIDHNTIFQNGPIIASDGSPANRNFVFTNNITPHNDYGVWGSGQGVGVTALNFYFPGAIFQKNVIVGIPQGVSYPANNFLLVSASLDQVGFVNRAGGDYRLGPNSPYRNAGTDGRDIGCDVIALPQ
jgi:purple acid phosphatase-like protein/parallel beta helix pectate lyase-like protein